MYWGILVAAIAPAAARAAAPTVLLDFEDPAQAQGLLKPSGPQVELSSQHATRGRTSLKLTFAPYVAGGPQWPMFAVRLDALGAARDWSRARYLCYDAYNAGEEPCELRVLLADEDRREAAFGSMLPPLRQTTVRLDLRGATGLDLSRALRLGFYITRPPRESVVYLDYVRLLAPSIDEPGAISLSLASPNYHDGLFTSYAPQSIRVQAAIDAPAAQVAECRLSLSLADMQGKVLAAKDLSPSAKVSTIELACPGLADNQRIAVRAAVSRAAESLATLQRTLTRYPKAADEVAVREDGITLVNGTPFFPLGMYQSPPEEFDYLRGLGFNAAHSYRPEGRAYFEAAARAGLRVLTTIGGTRSQPPYYHEPIWDPAQVQDYVQKTRDLPGLLGYYLYDEPTTARTPREKLLELVDLVRGADPYHIAAGCNNGQWWAYGGVPDAMMTDVYPIRAGGDVGDIVSRVRESVAAQSPRGTAWFIPQAFSLEPYFATAGAGQPIAKPPLARLPTLDEVRTMPWIGIACGARGLFFYSFQTQGFYVRDAYPVFWHGYCAVVREIAALLPALAGPDASPPVRSDRGELCVLAKQAGDERLIIAANPSRTRIDATLTLPGLGSRRLAVISEERQIEAQAGALRDTFEPLQTHLYTTAVGVPKLKSLAEVRAEMTDLETKFDQENRSVCTYRDGATLDASWGFPPAVAAPWYRMIDGCPGTPWTVGSGFRLGLVEQQWAKKDFRSAGRWIEVRLPEPRAISEIVAVTSAGSRFEIRVFQGGQWQALPAETTPDSVNRHYRERSATTRSTLATAPIDRFRIVFTDSKRSGDAQDVIFELLAR
jgi:hypothetical protein